MDIFLAIFLGIIQGLSEFLPISSSAHLIFFQEFLGISQANLAFDTLLHLGTLLAVFTFFYKDILEMIKAFFLSIIDIFAGNFLKGIERNPYKKLVWLVLIASIPTGIIGFLFKSDFEAMFGGVTLPAFFLLITGILLFLSQRINIGNRSIKNMGILDTLIIGIVQGLAIIPGISRSGSTISTGLFLGLNKEFTAKFSFLLSIPAIIGATLVQIKDISLGLDSNLMVYIMGFLAAAITGYIAISVLIDFIKNRSLDVFAYYCWFIAIVILAYEFIIL
ncbi:undecaprenyl-diphosphate phosphatase [Methanobrevibacter sp. OttesenSCG-928-K11]|nr:undecaprenyl-diphosphate phosphatase [Methanobrevibacter sp. OttesenSCG-928-K11]